MPATFITFFRMLGSGALFLIVLLIRKRPLLVSMLKDRETVIQLIVFAICGLLANQTTYTLTIGYTNAGTATVFQCLGIAFVMLFACVTTKRLPRLREVVGIVLATSSTFILATHGDPTNLVLPLPGILWGLASGLAAAIYIIYPRRLLRKWGSFAVTGLGMVVGSFAAFFIAQPWSLSLTLDGGSFAGMAGIVLLGTFGAYYLFLQGVADIGPVRASMLSAFEPVSATFFSWIWLGTQFPVIDYVGFAMMIVMVLVITGERSSVKEPEQAEPEHESETGVAERRT